MFLTGPVPVLLPSSPGVPGLLWPLCKLRPVGEPCGHLATSLYCCGSLWSPDTSDTPYRQSEKTSSCPSCPSKLVREVAARPTAKQTLRKTVRHATELSLLSDCWKDKCRTMWSLTSPQGGDYSASCYFSLSAIGSLCVHVWYKKTWRFVTTTAKGRLWCFTSVIQCYLYERFNPPHRSVGVYSGWEGGSAHSSVLFSPLICVHRDFTIFNEFEIIKCED